MSAGHPKTSRLFEMTHLLFPITANAYIIIAVSMETAPAPKTQKTASFPWLLFFAACGRIPPPYVLFCLIVSSISHTPVFVGAEIQVITL